MEQSNKTISPDSPPENQALQMLRQMRRIHSSQKNDRDNLHERGLMLLQIADDEGAADCFRRAIAASPDFSFSHHSLGEALLNLNETEAARTAVEKAVSLNQFHAASYALLADVFVKQSKQIEAVEMYRRSLELQPGLIRALKNLSLLLVKISPANQKEAYEIFRRAVKSEPQNIAIYRAALDYLPPDADLLTEFGENLAANNSLDFAAYFFRLAAAINADSPKIWLRLAEILLHGGDAEGAKICSERAKNLTKEN